MIVWNNTIPAAANNPSADQPLMLANNINLPLYVAVDHIPFNVANSGYHNVIHQPPYLNNTWQPTPKIGAPAPILGINQLFSLNYLPNYSGAMSDTQLFNMTGMGGVSQLTGNNTVSPTDGWAWMGGMLLQWGFVAISGVSPRGGTVTFGTRIPTGIPFPTACFNVQVSLFSGGLSPLQSVAVSGGVTNAAFNWIVSWTIPSVPTGFYWVAIGF